MRLLLPLSVVALAGLATASFGSGQGVSHVSSYGFPALIGGIRGGYGLSGGIGQSYGYGNGKFLRSFLC